MFSTLRAKIFAGYLAILVLLAALGVYAIYSFRSLDEITASGLETSAQSTLANLSMYGSLSRINAGTIALIDGGGSDASNLIASQSYEFYDALARMQRFISSQKQSSQAIQVSEALTRIEISWQQYEALLRQLQEYLTAYPEDVRRFYTDILMPAYNNLVALIFDLTERNVRAFNDLRKETTARSESAIVGVITVTLASLLLGTVVSYILARRTTAPLGALRESIQDLEAGNLSIRIPVAGNDEIGDVSFEFNRLVERLEEYERMNISEILREKQKSEAIISSIDAPLFLFGMNWELLLANRAAERISGHALKAGISIEQAIGDQHLISLIRQLAGNERGIDDVPLIVSIFASGKPRYYKIGVLWQRVEGTLGGYLVVFTDITHFKEIDELRSDFIAKVSHEFRTPLTSMKIALDLLSRTTTGAINKDQHELIETTKNDADRLDKLIKDLLAVARLEASHTAEYGDEAFTDTAKVFDDVIGSLRRQFDAKGVQLASERSGGNSSYRIPRSDLESVMQNLLTNALKFTPPGGEVAASLTYDTDTSALTIRIADTGIGVAREDQERIFEKFVQIKPSDSATPGSVGLGLAIVSEIARQYSGNVTVVSEKGKGSIFTVTLNVNADDGRA